MGWGALTVGDWISWTPTLTGTSSNPSGYSPIASYNKYQQQGNLIICRFGLQTTNATGNSVGTGSWRMSLPIQPKHSGSSTSCGYYYLYNAEVGSFAVALYGSVSLHSTSQSASTVEFVEIINAGSNSIQTLPTGISYPTKQVSINGQFFYEAL